MELLQSIADSFNYWIYIILMMIGLYALVAKNNLVKKLIGMSIFQTAIILFYVSIGYKDGATIPILYEHQAHHGHHDAGHGDAADTHHDSEHAVEEAAKEIHAASEDHADVHDSHADDHATLVDSHDVHASSAIHAKDFANPLVHVLMLTAIVVGVATLGVGLAITQKLYGEFGSIEESEIIEQIRTGK